METVTWLNFAENVIGHIAWPLCVFVIIFLLKKPIIDILDRIKSLNAGSVSAEFYENRINDLSDLVAGLSKPQAASETVIQPNNDTIKIAEASSAAAILYAYSRLEKAMKEILSHVGLLENYCFTNDIPKLLLKHKKINSKTFNVIDEMRKIRNNAGRELLELEIKTIIEYDKNIEQMINIIKSETS
jgi:hypothetical protein